MPYRKLTAAICSVLDDHSMLAYLPFSEKKEDDVLSRVFCIAYLSLGGDYTLFRGPRDTVR